MTSPLLLKLPWGSSSVGGFTSTRQGGCSKGAYNSLNLGLNTADDAPRVVENRRLAAHQGGIDPSRIVYACQIHSDRIVEVQTKHAGLGSLSWDQGIADCDALWTRTPGLGLAMGHADCLVVALADVQAGILGIAHAGWRGALAALPAKLVSRMISEGAQAERLQAFLSPCLGPDSLELASEQYDLFTRAFEHSEDFCSALKKGHFLLNLWGCVKRQLLDAGLDATHVQGQEIDTGAHSELFYSHRRDNGKTGRMMTVVSLN